MSQIRADVELRIADLALKQQQLRWEPVKLMAGAAAAGAALMGGAVAVLAAIFRHV